MYNFASLKLIIISSSSSGFKTYQTGYCISYLSGRIKGYVLFLRIESGY
jgi:hypothetical protein